MSLWRKMPSIEMAISVTCFGMGKWPCIDGHDGIPQGKVLIPGILWQYGKSQYVQYHSCRWPGDTRSQVISSHGIDLIGSFPYTMPDVMYNPDHKFCNWDRYYHLDFPDSKVYGTNMGPTWERQNPCGPHVGPMNLAIWVVFLIQLYRYVFLDWLCVVNKRNLDCVNG